MGSLPGLGSSMPAQALLDCILATMLLRLMRLEPSVKVWHTMIILLLPLLLLLLMLMMVVMRLAQVAANRASTILLLHPEGSSKDSAKVRVQQHGLHLWVRVPLGKGTPWVTVPPGRRYNSMGCTPWAEGASW